MNLLYRVLTAVILLPVVLWVVYSGGWVLRALLGLVFALGVKEYWEMKSLGKKELSGLSFVVIAYLGFGLMCLALLREKFGFEAVVLVLITTFSCDTFAYFVGRTIGKHKMAPKISEKKTWEGFVGGVVGAVAVPLVCQAWLLPLTSQQILWVCIPCAVLAPVGDLLESKIKRFYGVKDSGNLLPGHGGILDRIDALLLTAPWAFFALTAL